MTQYKREKCAFCEKELNGGHWQAFTTGKPSVINACTKAHARAACPKRLSITDWWHTTKNSMSEMFRL